MEGRSFSNKLEERRLRNHIINDRYENILILWGAETLVELVYWYQFIGYQEGVADIIKCLKDYSEEYHS
jgi:hypothetical protein